jgi:hypothetical protein
MKNQVLRTLAVSLKIMIEEYYMGFSQEKKNLIDNVGKKSDEGLSILKNKDLTEISKDLKITKTNLISAYTNL